jgi:hypothetical protein
MLRNRRLGSPSPLDGADNAYGQVYVHRLAALTFVRLPALIPGSKPVEDEPNHGAAHNR